MGEGELFGPAPREKLATGCNVRDHDRVQVHSSGRGQRTTDLLAHLGFKHICFHNKCMHLKTRAYGMQAACCRLIYIMHKIERDR